jgi:competence CoiA-like predicted nuclease
LIFTSNFFNKFIQQGVNILFFKIELVLATPVRINLKTIDYHLAILTKQFYFFSNKKNHNQNYQKNIDFFLKNKKITNNIVIYKVRKT